MKIKVWLCQTENCGGGRIYRSLLDPDELTYPFFCLKCNNYSIHELKEIETEIDESELKTRLEKGEPIDQILAEVE